MAEIRPTGYFSVSREQISDSSGLGSPAKAILVPLTAARGFSRWTARWS
jgi:hypothetical protein